MAVFQGYVSQVEVSTQVIGEQNTWRYTVDAPPETYFVFGDINEKTLPGGVVGQGTISGYYDTDDTQQTAILDAVEAGTQVDLGIYPKGNTSGELQYRGNVSVTNVETGAQNPGIGEFSMQFRGVLTRSTVT